jgi:hypothetical protein
LQLQLHNHTLGLLHWSAGSQQNGLYSCLQVYLNSADLSGFQVADSEVQQRYRYKNLKAAMCHIPDGKELGGRVSTKVGLLLLLLQVTSAAAARSA